jgi:DNA-binding NarL/FixJ family response regulator
MITAKLVCDEALNADLLTRSIAPVCKVEPLAGIPRSPVGADLLIVWQRTLDVDEAVIWASAHGESTPLLLIIDAMSPDLFIALNDGIPEAISILLESSLTGGARLLEIVPRIAGGVAVIDPEIASYNEATLGKLTPRQREIAVLVALGRSNHAIAQQLGLTDKTIENQLGRIYQTLGVQTADARVHPRVTLLRQLLHVPG